MKAIKSPRAPASFDEPRELSQRDLCRVLGMSETTLRRWLNGYKPRPAPSKSYCYQSSELPAIVAFIEARQSAARLRVQTRVHKRAEIPRFYNTRDLAKRANVSRSIAARFVRRRNGPPRYFKSWQKFDSDELEILTGELLELKATHPTQPLRGLRSQQQAKTQ